MASSPQFLPLIKENLPGYGSYEEQIESGAAVIRINPEDIATEWRSIENSRHAEKDCFVASSISDNSDYHIDNVLVPWGLQ